MRTVRRSIFYGGRLNYEPPDGAAAYRFWTRTAPTDPVSRWQEGGGYDIVNALTIAAPAGNTALDGLGVGPAGASVMWESIDAVAAHGVTEAIMVIAYSADREALRADVYSVPVQDTGLNAVIAQERAVLREMIDQRHEAATTTGLKSLQMPDGRVEDYVSILVWDQRVAELRARIAWLEAAASGDVLPRIELW